MRFILRQTSLFFKVVFVTSLILILAISFNVMWNTGLHEASIEKLTHEKTKIIQNSSKKMSSEQWRREDILTCTAF